MVNIVSKETEKNRKIVTGEIIIRKFNIRRSACEQRSLKTIENFFPLWKTNKGPNQKVPDRQYL